MKRIITALLCMALLPTVSAFAETGINELSARQSGSRIEISGSITDMVSPLIQLTILKPGASGVTETGVSDSAVLVYQSDAVDENGKFSFSVSIGSRAESGEYTLVLNTVKGGAAVKTVFSYLSDSDRNEILTVLNSKNAAQIYSAISDTDNKELIESFGISLDLYSSMSEENKRKVSSLIADDYTDSGAYTVNSFGEAFNIITAYTDIITSSGAAVFDKLRDNSGLLGISTEDMIDDELVSEYIKNASVSDKLSGFVKAFNRAKAVSAVNNTVSYMDIYGVLEKYNDVFGISFAGYNSLGSASKTQVLRDMINKKPYQTPEAVKQSFNNAVSSDSQSKAGSSGGGGGGGGGGSLSAGGSSYVGLTTVDLGGNLPDAVNTTQEQTRERFNDISGVPWAREAINSLAEAGIINGTDERSFEPDRMITRAEFVKIISLAFRLDTSVTDCDFSDVNVSDWYYEYVAAATGAGIVNGMDDGSFGAAQNITREDLAVIAYRAAGYAGTPLYIGDGLSFSDSEQISGYAAEAVGSLASAGIINGTDNNMFEPKSAATRAQAAKIIYMLINVSAE